MCKLYQLSLILLLAAELLVLLLLFLKITLLNYQESLKRDFVLTFYFFVRVINCWAVHDSLLLWIFFYFNNKWVHRLCSLALIVLSPEWVVLVGPWFNYQSTRLQDLLLIIMLHNQLVGNSLTSALLGFIILATYNRDNKLLGQHGTLGVILTGLIFISNGLRAECIEQLGGGALRDLRTCFSLVLLMTNLMELKRPKKQNSILKVKSVQNFFGQMLDGLYDDRLSLFYKSKVVLLRRRAVWMLGLLVGIIGDRVSILLVLLHHKHQLTALISIGLSVKITNLYLHALAGFSLIDRFLRGNQLNLGQFRQNYLLFWAQTSLPSLLSLFLWRIARARTGIKWSLLRLNSLIALVGWQWISGPLGLSPLLMLVSHAISQ